MNTFLNCLVPVRLVALAATIVVTCLPAVAEEPKPGLEIVEPTDGRAFAPTDVIQVRAVGIGKFGGILDVALLVDGRVAGESHIRFIRAPDPDQPVFHEFEVTGLEVGSHSLVVQDTIELGVSSKPVTIVVLETPPKPPSEPVPSLRIVSPASGAIVLPGETLQVDAVAVGRYGGITRLELLLDGSAVARSEIVFIRAPRSDEPVHHQFELERTPPAGAHQLSVREIGNPDLASKEVSIQVVEPLHPSVPALLRLTSLADGSLLLVVNGPDQAASYDIQASYDLLNWQSVNPDKPASRGPVSTSSVTTPGPVRYYRAVVTDPK